MSSCLFTESQELADEDARYEAEYADFEEFGSFARHIAKPEGGETIHHNTDPMIAE